MNGCKAVGLLLVLITLSSSAVAGNGALCKTEVDTAITVLVPPTVEASSLVNVEIKLEPASVSLQHLTLTITDPDGTKKSFSPIVATDGICVWTYSINQLGDYIFQCSFPGEEKDGIYYKPAQSQTATLTSIGDTVPLVEPNGGTWQDKQPMSQARAGLGVTALNGKIYAIGGSVDDGPYNPSPADGLLSLNGEYDPATDTWVTKEQMPTVRCNFAIAACQGKIYCIGGIVGTQLDDTYHLFQVAKTSGINEVYDPATDTWATQASLPVEISGASAYSIDNAVYLFTGNTVWMYNPDGDVWIKKGTAPTQITDYASTVAGSKVYFIGNHMPLLIFDSVSGNWSQGGYSPRMAANGAAAATSGEFAPKRIYFFTVAQYGWVPYGKTDTSGASRRTTFIYNTESDNWSAGTPMPYYRTDFKVAVLNDRLYAIGGYTWVGVSGNVTVCATVDEYTPGYYGQTAPTSTPLSTEQAHIQTESPIAGLWMITLIGASIGILVIVLLAVFHRYYRKSAGELNP